MYELLVLSLLMHWPLHAYKIARIANNIIGPEEQISRGTLSSLLFFVQMRSGWGSFSSQPAYCKLQRIFFAVCLLLGPLLISLVLASGPFTLWSLGAGTFAVFCLLFGFLGMTELAMRRSPWLATIGGFLSLTGFIGYGLISMWQVELSYHSALLGGGKLLATLYDQINADPVQVILLLVFIIGHLIGPMLLGIALVRARLIPAWAMWVLILRIPLQAAGFIAKIGLTMEIYTYGLLFIASIPVAFALLTFRDEEMSGHASEQSVSAP